MSSQSKELLALQKNQDLKRLFANQDLDLNAVMEFTPQNLDLENRRLFTLAKFIYEYDQFGSRELMEMNKGEYVFPPIFPAIEPENDWYRFELWRNGEAIEKPLVEHFSDRTPFRKPADIAEEEMEAELERILNAINEANIGIGLVDGLPPRLLYTYLYEELGESFIVSNGGWVIDGCSGYCPGCFQRPWCNTGQNGCWPGDEKNGKMALPEELAAYVSASPQSLALLQEAQAKEDASRAKFRKENPDLFPPRDEDWTAGQN
jgi:hypothetical protein